ncbi:myTH4 domain-containing protein [Phthorimaea operculella]|nr:myTH4 domain-containing protein [Phthorimaea operculella]
MESFYDVVRTLSRKTLKRKKKVQPKPTTNGVSKERVPERETREHREPRESRESRESRDSREMREIRDTRETRASRDETEHAERRTTPPQHDGRHPLLQFAVDHFRQSPELEILKADSSLKSKAKRNEWTWKAQTDVVKWQATPLRAPLLRLPPALGPPALECFTCIRAYCGDLPPAERAVHQDLTEVKCVYTVLMHCHSVPELRDEVYCQLMKQTTSNRSPTPDSCQRAWRLMSILAAYFTCSNTLRPFLVEYLSAAAADRRRPCQGTAVVCLQNLRKTLRCGGRKNVPSVEEFLKNSPKPKKMQQKRQKPEDSEDEDGCFTKIMSEYQSSANKMKKVEKKSADTNGEQKQSRQKLLDVMDHQMSARRQVLGGVLSSLSEVLAQQEADCAALAENEKKIEHLAGAFLKCVQQSTAAANNNRQALKEIRAGFSKEFEELESAHKVQVERLAEQLEQDMEKLQQKLVAETKRKQLDNLRKSIFSAMQNDF